MINLHIHRKVVCSVVIDGLVPAVLPCIYNIFFARKLRVLGYSQVTSMCMPLCACVCVHACVCVCVRVCVCVCMHVYVCVLLHMGV